MSPFSGYRLGRTLRSETFQIMQTPCTATVPVSPQGANRIVEGFEAGFDDVNEKVKKLASA